MKYDTDDDLDDFDDRDDTDFDDDDTEPTLPCPECQAELHEDAVHCPFCGCSIERRSSSHWDGKPVWWIVMSVLGIFAVILTSLMISF
jgi:hypothetical protein